MGVGAVSILISCVPRSGHICRMLSVLFKNLALSANSPNQIKSDEYLKYEACMKFISMMIGGKYKGFQVLNTALNLPKMLSYGSHNDLKQPHIMSETQEGMARAWVKLL